MAGFVDAAFVDAADWCGRPRPALTPDTEAWWAGVAAGELRFQCCTGCGHRQHPPEPSCVECGRWDPAWVTSAGRGSVYSFVVYHEPRLPGFAYPYVVAVVELDEGVRLIANLVDVPPAEVRVGQRVAVVYHRVEDGFTLPAFRPESP
jgi:uncharacterized OB-fold protein